MVRTISKLIDAYPYLLAFASRRRKIRCDGAKPRCYHCSRQEENGGCTYDALPKRRGPDKIQRTHTSSTRQETDGGPPPRRRRHRPTTVIANQVASESLISRQPRVAGKPSVLDTFEDSTLFVDSQQYDACIHTLNPGFELLEGIASHDQMLTLDPTSTGHDVSRLFLPFMLY